MSPRRTKLEAEPQPPRRRRWWVKIVVVLAVCGLALLIGVLVNDSLRTPAAVRAATRFLRTQDSSFDPDQYRVTEVQPSADGRFVRVTFERTAGRGSELRAVSIPAPRTGLSGLFDFLLESLRPAPRPTPPGGVK